MKKVKINKLPKGYHRMPDGTIMRDSDHKKYGGNTLSQGSGPFNLEAEGGETIVTDKTGNGIPELYKIVGPRHSQGGVKMNESAGSFIYSDTPKMKLGKELNKFFGKSDKKAYTPAELSKQYLDMNEDKLTLMDENADRYALASAEMNLFNKTYKLGGLAMAQEAKKNFEDGIPQIANLYASMNGIPTGDSTMPAGMQTAKYGKQVGYPKYQDNGQVQADTTGLSAFLEQANAVNDTIQIPQVDVTAMDWSRQPKVGDRYYVNSEPVSISKIKPDRWYDYISPNWLSDPGGIYFNDESGTEFYLPVDEFNSVKQGKPQEKYGRDDDSDWRAFAGFKGQQDPYTKYIFSRSSTDAEGNRYLPEYEIGDTGIKQGTIVEGPDGKFMVQDPFAMPKEAFYMPNWLTEAVTLGSYSPKASGYKIDPETGEQSDEMIALDIDKMARLYKQGLMSIDDKLMGTLTEEQQEELTQAINEQSGSEQSAIGNATGSNRYGGPVKKQGGGQLTLEEAKNQGTLVKEENGFAAYNVSGKVYVYKDGVLVSVDGQTISQNVATTPPPANNTPPTPPANNTAPSAPSTPSTPSGGSGSSSGSMNNSAVDEDLDAQLRAAGVIINDVGIGETRYDDVQRSQGQGRYGDASKNEGGFQQVWSTEDALNSYPETQSLFDSLPNYGTGEQNPEVAKFQRWFNEVYLNTVADAMATDAQEAGREFDRDGVYNILVESRGFNETAPGQGYDGLWGTFTSSRRPISWEFVPMEIPPDEIPPDEIPPAEIPSDKIPPKVPPFIQDRMQLAGLAAIRGRNEMLPAWAPRVETPLMKGPFLDPTNVNANIQASASQAIQGSNMFAGSPSIGRATGMGIQAKASEQIAKNIADVENKNVALAGNYASQNRDALMRGNAANAQLAAGEYAANNQARDIFNMRNAQLDAANTDAWKNLMTNWANARNISALTDPFYLDTDMGGVYQLTPGYRADLNRPSGTPGMNYAEFASDPTLQGLSEENKQKLFLERYGNKPQLSYNYGTTPQAQMLQNATAFMPMPYMGYQVGPMGQQVQMQKRGGTNKRKRRGY
jgi:hypothetical protein